jgi:phage replication-related protein YjqB (UPF0714/DUF867 family)
MTLPELLKAEGVEERVVLAGRLGLMAFHGGLEGGTETIAAAAAEASGASLYLVVQPPDLRWHLPSHVVGASPSPGLESFLAHIDVAIAVHGYGRPDRRRDILLGGRNRVLAAAIADALRHRLSGWEIIDDIEVIPASMRGLHADNPVNQARLQGVQMELPPAVRGTTGRWMDDNSGCVPDPDLIAVLGDIARTENQR